MADVYLTNKPTGAALAFLIVALVLFILAALASYSMPPRTAPPHYLAGGLTAAGLAFLTLAFIVPT